MTTLTIIGMGLIGTSLGIALRTANPKHTPLSNVYITGYDTNKSATRTARNRLAIDHQAKDMAEAVQQAHIVVIATPVQAIHPILSHIAPWLSPGTIVTDVASTKAQVCAWAHELLPEGIEFVGGHPMAGKELSGAEAADPELFKDAIYCLTPDASNSQHALDTIEAIVKTVGAKPYHINAVEHDAYVAGISHLPFVLSTALVAVTSRSPAWKEMAVLAASGFRDVSRLASGDVLMHRDICTTNRAALIRWINDTVGFLLEMREHLEHEDEAAIETLFAHAQKIRDAWLEQKGTMRPGEDAFESLQQVQHPGFLGIRTPGGKKHLHDD